MNNLLLLIGIMILGGAIGGIANYFTSEIPADESHPFLKRIAVGITAALVVPLFLNMISSSILDDAGQMPTNYLVFTGFCIIAGFGSRTFLTSVSKRILDEVRSVEQRQTELEQDVEPIIAKETEPELEPDAARTLGVEFDPDEQNVLEALANPTYARRYVSGLVSETGLSGEKVTALLQGLGEKDLVRSKRGRQRDLFWLTPKGRNLLRSQAADSHAAQAAPVTSSD